MQNGYETEPRGGAEYACARERTLATANSGDRSLGDSCKNRELEVVAVSEVQVILFLSCSGLLSWCFVE